MSDPDTQAGPPRFPDEALLVDPRRGDIGNDASSTKQRSLLAIAGSLLAEISLPKLLLAWLLSIVIPGILLGVAPLVATAWLAKVSGTFAGPTGIGAALALIAAAGLGWIGWRPLLRTAEKNFWSLNALAVQPGYAFCREAIRHFSELAFGGKLDSARRENLRKMSAAGSGLVLCGLSAFVASLAWPMTHWVGTAADFLTPHWLITSTLANAIVLVAGYCAIASFAWGIADAAMDSPRDIEEFGASQTANRTWRIAHLSDIHVVGERYGFRIESGRGGPRGNDRFECVMKRLEEAHAEKPLDLIVISGDMTDAGTPAEWAEFLDTAAKYPALAARMLVLPGNHDVNIVDRGNPARLDLPFSPGKRLRQVRALSAIAALQAGKVSVFGEAARHPKHKLSEAVAPHREAIAEFADLGSLRLSRGLGRLWDSLYPMVLPPGDGHGLGVILLNSNAETHFSFTNALGLVPVEQADRVASALEQFPDAVWIVALHHHLIEYPMPASAFSERIGTALINGSWFIRRLRPFARRIVVMHGHRHIDWMGECGGLKILSAPSPVMGKPSGETHFYIHTLARTEHGTLSINRPHRVAVSVGGP